MNNLIINSSSVAAAFFKSSKQLNKNKLKSHYANASVEVEEEARWPRWRARLTSVISKILSGSRLPPPTFLVQVTVPLCVTEMIRLATEQAFSCRVASTTCRWPTCRVTGKVRGAKQRICFIVYVIMGFRKWAYLAQSHYTRDVFYIESHTIIRVIWQLNFLRSFVISWYMHSGNPVSKVIRSFHLAE